LTGAVADKIVRNNFKQALSGPTGEGQKARKKAFMFFCPRVCKCCDRVGKKACPPYKDVTNLILFFAFFMLTLLPGINETGSLISLWLFFLQMVL